MKRLLSVLLSLPLPGLVAAAPVNATSGALDDNTCHYKANKRAWHCHDDNGENPDQEGPVEKSRENVRHERASPNYKQLKRFVSWPTLGTCQKSGDGRRGS